MNCNCNPSQLRNGQADKLLRLLLLNSALYCFAIRKRSNYSPHFHNTLSRGVLVFPYEAGFFVDAVLLFLGNSVAIVKILHVL